MATPTGYSRLQISLHWIVLVLIVIQFVAHEGMEQGWKVFERTGEMTYSNGVWLHIISGSLVLLFAIWRLFLRLTRGVPTAPHSSSLLKLLAEGMHWLLYLLVFIVPVSGLVAWFGAVKQAGEAHEVLKSILLLAVALHLAAALVHHFILKTDVLRRMLRAS